mmetsp:Transcript_7561/g.24642  ORF Transcript_7561/g.24642 Transcript_7561/m.24642 type:complete len:376 (+) Transcript_7561:632-1759(+)
MRPLQRPDVRRLFLRGHDRRRRGRHRRRRRLRRRLARPSAAGDARPRHARDWRRRSGRLWASRARFAPRRPTRRRPAHDVAHHRRAALGRPAHARQAPVALLRPRRPRFAARARRGRAKVAADADRRAPGRLPLAARPRQGRRVGHARRAATVRGAGRLDYCSRIRRRRRRVAGVAGPIRLHSGAKRLCRRAQDAPEAEAGNLCRGAPAGEAARAGRARRVFHEPGAAAVWRPGNCAAPRRRPAQAPPPLRQGRPRRRFTRELPVRRNVARRLAGRARVVGRARAPGQDAPGPGAPLAVRRARLADELGARPRAPTLPAPRRPRHRRRVRPSVRRRLRTMFSLQPRLLCARRRLRRLQARELQRRGVAGPVKGPL